MPTESPSLFPEWEEVHGGPPPRSVTKAGPWSPGPNARVVLGALANGGPMDDHEVFESVAGRMTRGSCEKAVEELAKHGAIVDTGERRRWTAKGRTIVWRIA